MRLVAVLTALLLTPSTFAQLRRAEMRAVDQVMVSAMKAWQIPGASLVIVRNDRVVHLAGYGTTEQGGAQLVGADTLFQIASASKAFTTATLAMLVADGKISWDDPVRKHVPYFRLSDLCADSQVMVRDLVTHRTGLARHDELWDNSPLTREEVVRRVGALELARPFRTAYQYHNIMFIAAGEVVSHASGMPWDEFARTRIFAPLSMNGTVTSDADWERSEHATGYRFDWKKGSIAPQRPIDTTTIGSAGAIKSSARDMGNWVRFQLADGMFDGVQIVDPKALAETRTPQTVIRLEGSSRDTNPESSLISYAMGWVVQDYRGEQLVSHAGALNGFRTHVDLLPKRSVGFAVMANVGRGYAVVAIRNALIDVLTGKAGRDWNAYYLMLEQRENEKEAKERAERDAKKIAGTTPALPLAEYAGTYESPVHGEARLALEGDTLVLSWSRLSIPLTHFHYDVFSAQSEADDVDEQVSFTLGPDRKVKSLTFYGQEFVRR